MLDDGRITDSQGRTVDFKNTIIIMTSNLGSHLLLEGIRHGVIRGNPRRRLKLLQTQFRPEFLNRIDDIVFYKPLEREEIAQIVRLLAGGLQKRLQAKDVELTLTDRAVEAIVDAGFDPVYGARPLKRYLQSKLETLIARSLVSGEILPAKGLVDVDGSGELTLGREVTATGAERRGGWPEELRPRTPPGLRPGPVMARAAPRHHEGPDVTVRPCVGFLDHFPGWATSSWPRYRPY